MRRRRRCELTCPRDAPSAIGTLLTDAAGWWQRGTTWEMPAEIAVPTLPGSTGPGRYERAERLVDGLDLAGGDRPVFTFLHLVMPHGPWEFTDDGTRYERPDATPGALGPSWTHVGHQVGQQRHILQVQATDALLGRLIDSLHATDAYDDALVVGRPVDGERHVEIEAEPLFERVLASDPCRVPAPMPPGDRPPTEPPSATTSAPWRGTTPPTGP